MPSSLDLDALLENYDAEHPHLAERARRARERAAQRDPIAGIRRRDYDRLRGAAEPEFGVIESFLQMLYEGCSRGSCISVSYQSRGAGMRTEHFPAPSDWPLAQFVADQSWSGDVWINAATRREGLARNQRGGAAECVQVPGLWIDVDDGDAPWHDKPGLPRGEQIADYLHALEMPKPTVLLWTGGGVQAWWKFDAPLPVYEAKPLLDEWRAHYLDVAASMGFTVDDTADVPRMVRCAGTLNWKPPSGPVPVAVLS